MGISEEMIAVSRRAVTASRKLAQLNARKRTAILHAMADEVETQAADITLANRRDIDRAGESGLTDVEREQLLLTPNRLAALIRSLRAIADVKDPVGEAISRWLRPNGLEVVKRRVPIGVVGIIYESTPRITVDASALCMKTSNALILRGGDAIAETNRALIDALLTGGTQKGLPENAIQLIKTADPQAIRELIKQDELIDVIIPQGSSALIRMVSKESRIPVIKPAAGVCHLYVDKAADPEMAVAIADNAKCQRPSVSSAIETLLVHRDIAPTFLPLLGARLAEKGVELRGCPRTRSILPDAGIAQRADWTAEYLAPVLAIKIVTSIGAAIRHIEHFGSSLADAIVSHDEAAQKRFANEVDSAAVYINASTRFTDGGEFGMGADIGLSADKMNARGPIGLQELTTYKFVVHGKGQIRE
jgi:glutamate-5-semialdehyde dehydrogenase